MKKQLLNPKQFHILFSAFLICVLSIFISACGKSLPDEAKNLVFEGEQFNQQFVYQIPCDEKLAEQNVIKMAESSVGKSSLGGGLPPAYFSPSNNIGEDILRLLKKNKLGEVKTDKLNTGMGYYDYNFLIYSDDIKKYLVDPKAECKSNIMGSNWALLFGHRKLKSVGEIIKNTYQISGLNVTGFFMNFKYEITTNIPGTSVKSSEYNGTARLYLDPETKKWIVDEIKLNDYGIQEYIW